jgi:hypothetical protein
VKQPISPADVKCSADVCSLQRSHKSVGRYDMLIQHDGAAIFTEHEKGKPCTASITVPRHVFKQFIEWYNTPQSHKET